MNITSFVIRVYGIYTDSSDRILVSDEIIRGKNITKFPGGGMEFGEGAIECLKREMLEEAGQEFEIVAHFYTTDFFVESAFNNTQQVVSIYYKMKPVNQLQFPLSENRFQFKSDSEGEQSFRFIEADKINPDDFALIIDRHVASLLADELKHAHEKNRPI